MYKSDKQRYMCDSLELCLAVVVVGMECHLLFPTHAMDYGFYTAKLLVGKRIYNKRILSAVVVCVLEYIYL